KTSACCNLFMNVGVRPEPGRCCSLGARDVVIGPPLFRFGQSKKLNKQYRGTPMNADKTWINVDKTGILSAWVADCAVQPMIDVKGGLAFRKWAETSGSQNPKRSQSYPQFIRFYPRSSASLYL